MGDPLCHQESMLDQRLREVEQRLLKLEKRHNEEPAQRETWHFSAEHSLDERMVLRLWKGPLNMQYGQPLSSFRSRTPMPTSGSPSVPEPRPPRDAFPSRTSEPEDKPETPTQHQDEATLKTLPEHDADISSWSRDNPPIVLSEDEIDNRTTPPLASALKSVLKTRSPYFQKAREEQNSTTHKRQRSISSLEELKNYEDDPGPQAKKPRKRISFADEVDGSATDFEPGSSFGNVVIGEEPQPNHTGDV